MAMVERRPLRLSVYIAAFALAVGLSAAVVNLTAWAQGLPGSTQGHVRIAHLAPGFPMILLSIDGRPTLNVEFGTVSEYVPLSARRAHRLTLDALGPDGTLLGERLAEGEITLQPGEARTLTLIAPQLAAMLSDDLTVEAGKAKLRIVHALPFDLYTPPLNVYVLDGREPLVQGLAFKRASPYLALDPGVYTLEIRPAGENETDVLLRLQGVRLEAKTVSTLFVFASAEGRAQGLLLVDVKAPSGLSPAVWLGLVLWALLLARFVWVHLAP